MRFTDFLSQDSIRLALFARDRDGVVCELGELLAAQTGLPARLLGSLLLERERTASTAVGEGVAIPHCRVPGLRRLTACLGVHPTGVSFGSPDSPPVFILVGLVSPPDAAGLHLKVLARVAGLMRNPRTRDMLRRAESPAEALRGLVRAEEEYVAARGLPLGEPRAL